MATEVKSMANFTVVMLEIMNDDNHVQGGDFAEDVGDVAG